MAVSPTVLSEDEYHVLLQWTLTSADDVALPSPAFPHRSEKTVDVYEAGGSGWNGATVDVQGDLNKTGTGEFKLLNSIPHTQDLRFTADSTKQWVILPNVTRLKPVRSAGTLGTAGVIVKVLVVSYVKRFR
jgi:hypothetical protein